MTKDQQAKKEPNDESKDNGTEEEQADTDVVAIPPGAMKAKFKNAVYSVIAEYHQSYIDYYPDDPYSYERQGYVLFSKGEYEKAIERLNQAYYLGTVNSRLWKILAQSYLGAFKQTQEWDYLAQARTAYDSAMKYLEVFTDPVVVFEYAIVQEKVGDFKGSLETIQKINEKFKNFGRRREALYRNALLIKHHTYSLTAAEGPLRIKLLKEAHDITKSLIGSTNDTNSNEFIELLYVSARVCEMLDSTKSRKHATRSFKELFRLTTANKMFENFKTMAEWHQTSNTWNVWASYFEDRAEFTLAIDAHREMMKRATSPVLQPSTLSLEPQCTYFFRLALLYAKANDMKEAIASAEKAIAQGPYIHAIRDQLVEWAPEKWAHVISAQKQAQIDIARVLRGNWGRDVAHSLRETITKAAIAEYEKSPYAPDPRKVLALHRPKTYGILFFQQQMACKRLQKNVRAFLVRRRVAAASVAHYKSKVDNLRWKLKKNRYEPRLRRKLGELSPHDFGVMFEAEDEAARLLQRVLRGTVVRLRLRRLRPEEFDRRARIRKVKASARIIQAHYRRYRSKNAMQYNLFVQRKQTKVAVNLQKLFKYRNNNAAARLKAKQELKVTQERRERHRVAACCIQRTWRRYVSGYYLDVEGNQPNEASILLQQLMRGHEALVEEEEELDCHVRKIQALWRGRKDRVTLSGMISRTMAARQPSRVAELVKKLRTEQTSIGWLNTMVWNSSDKFTLPNVFEQDAVIVNPQLNLNVEHTKVIAKHLNQNKKVRALVLTQGDMGGEGLIEIGNGLRANKGLTTLAIGPNSIGTDTPWCGALGNLSTVLKTINFHLRHLIIEDNEIEDVGAMHIADAVGDFFFSRYGHLEYLVLAKCSIGSFACKSLSNALINSRILKVLDLNGNKIDDSGVEKLATGLASNTSLVELNLSDNRVASAGAKHLTQALQSTNRTLVKLLLTNNNIKNDVVVGFRVMISSNNVLKVLQLYGNLIHEDNIDTIKALLSPLEKQYSTKKCAPIVAPSMDWFELEKAKLVRKNYTKKKRREALVSISSYMQPSSAAVKTLKSPIKSPRKLLRGKNTTESIVRPLRRRIRDGPLSGIIDHSRVLRTPGYTMLCKEFGVDTPSMKERRKNLPL